MTSTSLSSRTVVIIVVAGIALIIGGLILAQATPLIFPTQASAESQQVDNLFYVMLVIGGAIFLLVQGMLVYSIIRFRARAGDASDGIYLHGNTTLEIVWTAIPAVIVFILTLLSWQVWDSLQAAKPNEAVINVKGARFNWAYTYDVPLSIMPQQVDLAALPEPVRADIEEDGLLSVSSPVLYTFVNQPVVLHMQPADVIHSFWVPAFRVKQDLIPGRVTTVRFTPTLAGTYPVKCAELCGANHGMMYGDVVVLEDEASYNTMLMPMVEERLFPPADPALRGEQILSGNIYPCNTCHVLNDLSAFNWVGNVGPNLNGVADRAATERASATGLSPADYLYQAIHEPSAYLVPGFGNLMPNLNIPTCDAWAIVAYLATQSESDSAPFQVEQPAECVVAAGPQAEATAEATAEMISTPAAETTAEATAEATAAN